MSERGAALPMALFAMVGLTALALSVLTMSGLDPQIARNHVDLLRARYLAEAGLEYAFDHLASTVGSWDTILGGATCATGAVLAESPLPGTGTPDGTFIVRVRNDCSPGDERLTGTAIETAVDAASRDGNGRVVVVSTGAIGAAAHTVTAVVSHPAGPPGHPVPRDQIMVYSWSDE